MTTPCNNNCQLDDSKNICLGCKRTVEEIVRWERMTALERVLVMERLERYKT